VSGIVCLRVVKYTTILSELSSSSRHCFHIPP